MKLTSVAIIAAVLLAFGGWTAASSSYGPQTRLAPVTGADYVISIAVVRQPVGQQTKVTLSYSLAKGDGAIAHRGSVESIAGGEALRPLFKQTADEIADIVLTGRVPATRQSSELAVAAR
jgi:hypothetical protein